MRTPNSPEPTSTFIGTPGASFLQLLHEAGQHAEQHPSTLDRMVDNTLGSTRASERQKAAEWIHANAPFLYRD
ncbi:MAG: hypothetical protein NTX63_05355 [Candidatus Peregrinibacteria bacterium]|nr:hypothetical protein [Candidatus Peregrinibacteria bacterium]